MPKRYIFLFFCLCVLIYIIFAGFSITEPLLGDSPYYLISAKVFNNKALQPFFSKDIGMHHPPLYLHLLVLLDKFVDLEPVSARLIGILCFIITLVLIYAITQSVFKENKDRSLIGLMGIFLYAINPMVIQGSLIPFSGTTILVPLLLFFIYFFVNLKDKNKYLLLGIVFGLLLWVKLSTPLVLIPTIFIFYSLGGEFKRGIKESSLTLFIGVFLFIISWGIYCYVTKRPFLYTLLHYKNAFFHTSPFFLYSSINKIILNVARTPVRIILYTSPFYFLMFLMGFWHRLKEFTLQREIHYVDFLLISSLIIFFAFLFTGGLGHSVPRHHYPFLSLSAIIIASFITDKVKFKRNHLFLYGFAVIVVSFYNIFLVGDFLYSSDYALRESLIIAGKITGKVARNLIFQLILYVLPFFLVLTILKIKKASLAFYRTVFIWTIAACFSMNVLQAKADYHTVYCYGGKGTKEAIAFIRKIKRREGSIVTHKDIFYNIDERDYLTSPDYRFSAGTFSSPKRFISVIKNKKPDFVVYAISSNTVEQYRKVFNNLEVVDFLRKNFIHNKIGSYTIWLRKGR